GAGGKSVPLHGIPADHRSRRGGRRPPARSPRGGAAVTRNPRIIGRPRRRTDARAKVTGQTVFADDIMLPRMLHCRLLRSTEPHARIVAIDTSRAAELEGVLLVLTG